MEVKLVKWSHAWEQEFEDEKCLLMEKLGNYIIDIDHVGSTSIKGIMSKPIIDITVQSEIYPPTKEVLEILGRLDYRHEGAGGFQGQYWFVKHRPVTHHLHWCPVAGIVVKRQCAFRDLLNADNDLALQYQALKQDLARQFPNDTHRYTQRKNSFIEKVLVRAEMGV
ncbi:MAG: GrpB family protein [Phycisphaerae bacterium]|nr:GrpB family protein [Phycisphaerae bacterium]